MNFQQGVDEPSTIPFRVHVAVFLLLQQPSGHFHFVILSGGHIELAQVPPYHVEDFEAFLTLLAGLDRACRVVELYSVMKYFYI